MPSLELESDELELDPDLVDPVEEAVSLGEAEAELASLAAVD